MSAPKRAFGIDEATAELMQRLEEAEGQGERLALMRALSARRSADAARVLAEAFVRSDEPDERRELLLSVGRTQHERGVEILLRVARDNDHPLEARWAVQALGHTESVLAGEFLSGVLWASESAQARWAVEALGRLSAYPGAAALARVLEAAATRKNWTVALPAAEALSRRGWAAHWPSFQACLSSGDVPAGLTQLVHRAAVAFGVDLPPFDVEDSHLTTARQLRALASPELAWQHLSNGEPPSEAALQIWLSADRSPPEDAEPNVLAWLRAARARPGGLEEDWQWLKQSMGAVSAERAAALVVAHREADERGELPPVGQLPAEWASAIWRRVRDPSAIEPLATWVRDTALPVAVRVEAVNALVSQAQVELAHTAHRQAAISALVALEGAELPPRLTARVTRALGQVDCNDADVLTQWAHDLDSPSTDQGKRSAIYYALSVAQVPEAPALLTRAVAGLKAVPSRLLELEQALAALAGAAHSFSPAGLAPALDGVQVPQTRRSRWSLLRLLSRQALPGFTHLIDHSLRQGSPAEILLAVAAAARNCHPSLQAPLLELMREPNRALSRRATQVLAAHADAEICEALVEHLAKECVHPHSALAVIAAFRPAHPQARAELARQLERVAGRDGVFCVAEVAEAARALALSLVEPAPANTNAASDAQLSEAKDDSPVEGSSLLAEEARAVLRNAEITFARADLFDHTVDKSTATVEWVKMIDLLLQDRLGRAMFVGARAHADSMLAQMRQRAAALGLDDDTVAASDVMALLDCAEAFTEDSFPAYKLAAVSRAMVRGRIEKAPYRYVDGLRAWAALLLVHGRRFTCQGQTLEPLLPVHPLPMARVNALAARLNALQELRNHSAHRGTLMHREEMEVARTEALGVLSELSALLH